ncbi:hypothetical protein TNCV_173071 [Trichonephila clavipes]|nr:hypothetical protein TNCV_173071 [Trichonephila clavipes]
MRSHSKFAEEVGNRAAARMFDVGESSPIELPPLCVTAVAKWSKYRIRPLEFEFAQDRHSTPTIGNAAVHFNHLNFDIPS